MKFESLARSTDMPIDLDEVVDLFEGLHPRMMQLQSLLYEKEWSCTKTAEPGNWGVQAFASRYLAAHVEFCKTFRVRT